MAAVAPDTGEVGDGLTEQAAAWLRAVVSHRREKRAFGRVSINIVETPAGSELHLTEETTFRAGPDCPDPLAAAQKWASVQSARRRSAGVSGSVNIESADKNGRATLAKVIEVTVVAVPVLPVPENGCGPLTHKTQRGKTGG